MQIVRYLPLGGRTRLLTGVFEYGRLFVWLYDHPEVLAERSSACRFQKSGCDVRQVKVLGLVGFLQFIDRRREGLTQLAEGFDSPGSIVGQLARSAGSAGSR